MDARRVVPGTGTGLAEGEIVVVADAGEDELGAGGSQARARC